MVRIGQRLKDERLRRKLTLEEVSVATKIRRDFLEAIERGSYADLPSPAYAKGFVRNYAGFLGLPREQSEALFKRDFDEKRAVKVLPDGMTKTQEFPLRRVNTRRIMVGIFILVLVVGFLLFQYRSVFFAPQIDISSPKEGETVSQDIEISGRTDSSAMVTVNNEPVFVNSNGEFSKKLTLFSGKTSITIKARNRLGKETTLQRNIIVR